MDTAWLPAFSAPEQIRSLLPHLSMCILGVEEAEALTGKNTPGAAALALVEAGSTLASLKLGQEGCLLADNSGVQVIPSFPARAVDSTGAGDAFSAGLIYGYLKGLSLPAAGVLANAMGSLAVGVWGAGTTLPGREEARQLLETTFAASDGTRKDWIGEALRSLN
jgi:ribokinase